MGQGSSAETESNAGGDAREASGSIKTCYYELLAVARDATQDDIKKAYKKKALELHPDRNYSDVERATRLFTEVQGAYEVLSDPQERAWYDSHREAILSGAQSGSGGDTQGGPADVTTSEDVLKWFSMFASVRLSYDEENPKSFYAVLGKLFRKLAEEEREAAEWENEDATDYPDFGNARSGHEDYVKGFYTVWGNFKTAKTFSWCDAYRYSDAPDRRVKRLMEKENKKLRENAIREFNSNVQSFVMFVRKRDPRFLANTQTEAQRQAALLAASKEQAARQRAENAAKLRNYKAADWTQVSEETLYDGDEAVEDGTDEEGEEEEEEVLERYECIVCKKTYDSKGQMDAHERSKKHTKAVWQLKRQMQKENKEFDLDRDVRGWEKKTEDKFTPIDNDKVEADKAEQDSEPEAEKPPSTRNKPPSPSPSPSPPPSDDEDSDHVTPEKFSSRIRGSSPPTSAPSPSGLADSLSNTTLTEPDPQKPKLGKAKAKRAKKAAQSTVATETDASICATCQQSFLSNTKMFNHLRDNPSHATLVPATGGGGKQGKGKGKRK